MLKLISLKLGVALSILGLLAACATQPHHAQTDYTAFKKAQPHSILVLPPVNDSADVKASSSMLSQMTQPLAEAGYYVIPVALMEETFKQNGLTAPAEIEQVSPAKLRDIFGADAVLFSKITQYGSVYRVVDSTTVVAASAKLVDLKTGDVLWQKTARASGKEVGTNVDFGSGSLIGMLAQAAIKQVAHSLTDEGHDVAALTSTRLLSAGPPDGLMYGPRSPKFGSD
ncbi:DUF799 domain-containing protein [Paraburkholderia antibiotica]|uniref:DUF799 domain-containing protein n=1 Tax=Paraburkholderia antibiotica TaxID=2728839 RepID=A0A7X9ZWP5_9BURK|nr:DUF799 domain-containing protein [Paraburkholderia antibiotica]NML31162.1 DUF799 domain-containing protein [Paraburkholderia antibiotica]